MLQLIMNDNRFFIRRYLFRSGNHEHPSDKFYNTTVEVLPDVLSEESIVWQQFNTTTDGFLIVGSFNGFGVAEGTVDNRIGKLRELRLHVHSESENWVILSEVRAMINEIENDVR
jgi:alpha-1,3-mannosylglycoprotein beta-1,4-N-acetylglucosaminyltransferase A/B